MSPYTREESIGDLYQIPPFLRPGPQESQGHQTGRGRRVSFTVPPVQPVPHGGSPFPQRSEPEPPYTYRARSASVANAELHFNPSHSPGIPPLQHSTHAVPPSTHQPSLSSQHQSPPRRPDFLIIGLFALRLAKKLIRSLDQYPERDSDIAWINRFLRPYTRRDALAKISGERIENYVTHYPAIVARFIKQPRYPVAFTELNPDRKIADRALTDQECVDVVDFADAAGEWGSTVKLPGMEAQRIERLAERRRMAHF